MHINDLDLSQIWENELYVFIKDYEHPVLNKRNKRAEDSFNAEKNKELDEFLDSDLFDSASVGWDIDKKEFYKNEMVMD